MTLAGLLFLRGMHRQDRPEKEVALRFRVLK
jgi:hypothetical protein